MQERPNLLKAAVAAGRPHIGLWCSLASALTTEVVAGSGAGWLLIDSEHSPNDLRSIMAQLQILGGYPCEGVVRLPSDDPNLIKQAMDVGARSLMIPNVGSAAQARAIVAVMSYAPNGIRGFSVAHRANAFGRIAGYHARAREHHYDAGEAFGGGLRVGEVGGEPEIAGCQAQPRRCIPWARFPKDFTR